MQALRDVGQRVYRGAAWTTDAPFRETAAAIERARARGILAVEMEAAALYAFAEARQKPVLCVAHVTNRMAVSGGDFEKGQATGSGRRNCNAAGGGYRVAAVAADRPRRGPLRCRRGPAGDGIRLGMSGQFRQPDIANLAAGRRRAGAVASR